MSRINSANIIRGSTAGLTSGRSGAIFLNMLQWGDRTYLRWGKDTLIQHKLRN